RSLSLLPSFPTRRSSDLFLLFWLIFPAVFTVVISIARPTFLARYLVFCLPALILLAAVGLARLSKSWLLAPVLLLFVALSMKGTDRKSTRLNSSHVKISY